MLPTHNGNVNPLFIIISKVDFDCQGIVYVPSFFDKLVIMFIWTTFVPCTREIVSGKHWFVELKFYVKIWEKKEKRGISVLF